MPDLSGVANIFTMGLALLLLSFAVLPARADYPEYVKQACKDDYLRYCSNHELNTRELRACMRAAADELAPQCRTALKRSGERR